MSLRSGPQKVTAQSSSARPLPPGLPRRASHTQPRIGLQVPTHEGRGSAHVHQLSVTSPKEAPKCQSSPAPSSPAPDPAAGSSCRSKMDSHPVGPQRPGDRASICFEIPLPHLPRVVKKIPSLWSAFGWEGPCADCVCLPASSLPQLRPRGQ